MGKRLASAVPARVPRSPSLHESGVAPSRQALAGCRGFLLNLLLGDQWQNVCQVTVLHVGNLHCC